MKILISFLFVILLISLASAEDSFIFQQGTEVDMKVSCFDVNNTLCTSLTPCQLTINYPNQSNMVKNVTMTFNNQYYNYTLITNYTRVVGEYVDLVTCQGGGGDGFTDFTHLVNPTGIRPSLERTGTLGRSIWIIVAFGLASFVGFIFVSKPPAHRLGFLIFAFTMWLVAINLSLVSVQDEIINTNLQNFFSFFTVASFYMYWFFGALLCFLLIIGFFQNVVYKKTLEMNRRFGGPEAGYG